MRVCVFGVGGGGGGGSGGRGCLNFSTISDWIGHQLLSERVKKLHQSQVSLGFLWC